MLVSEGESPSIPSGRPSLSTSATAVLKMMAPQAGQSYGTALVPSTPPPCEKVVVAISPNGAFGSGATGSTPGICADTSIVRDPQVRTDPSGAVIPARSTPLNVNTPS